jgi:hypothetical protein
MQHLLMHIFAPAGDDQLIFDTLGFQEGNHRLVAISTRQCADGDNLP